MTTHGAFHWNELNTHDPEAAMAFYAATVGWSFEPMPMDGFVYHVAMHEGRAVAGIFGLSGPEFADMPAHWLAYLAVDDVDARVAAAEKAGATILKPGFDVPNVGRIAIVQDPTGAVMGWITPVPQG